MKFKAGDCVSTEGMTKEQHTRVCRWFIESGAEFHEDENYLSWGLYNYIGWSDVNNKLLHLDTPHSYHSSPTIYVVDDLFSKKKSKQRLPEGISQISTTVDGVYFDTIEEAQEHKKVEDIYKELNATLQQFLTNECCARLLKNFVIIKKEST